MALGSDQLMEPDAAAKVLQMLRDYFSPAALDMPYQDVAYFLHFKRTAQKLGDSLAKFALPPHEAKSPTQLGGLTRSWVRLHNASLPRTEKSLVLASAQVSLRIAGGARQAR